MKPYRIRRALAFLAVLLIIAVPMATVPLDEIPTLDQLLAPVMSGKDMAIAPELEALSVKGRAPKTGYGRAQFGNGWAMMLGCDTRNRILARDLADVQRSDDGCKVVSGTLADPYTGTTIAFERGETTSDDVQIDHVVALSNAWQTGAQSLGFEQRVEFSNDPLNLLAVSGPANEQKSDGDAATWLPANKPFRCQYVSRQIAVKKKYQLWVTAAERAAMQRVLDSC